MRKKSVTIKGSELVNLIYEAIVSRRNAEQIKFVTGDIGEVNFVDYFDINPKAIKKNFLINGGDIVSSFLGLKSLNMNFELLEKLNTDNLSAKEYHKCEFGILELWMFFSSSKTYGDKSFYMMATLNSNGKTHNGRKPNNIKASHFIMTSRLSSEVVGIAVVDLLAEVYYKISGFDLNVGTPEKESMGHF